MARRKQPSEDAQAQYLTDVALAATFDDLLTAARSAEQDYRSAQATRAPLAEQHALAMRLDTALTDVMRSAFAAMRAEIGPLGYDDRIYRRKAMATPLVHALHAEAQRLLTLRETHRLTGIPPLPGSIGLPPEPTGARSHLYGSRGMLTASSGVVTTSNSSPADSYPGLSGKLQSRRPKTIPMCHVRPVC